MIENRSLANGGRFKKSAEVMIKSFPTSVMVMAKIDIEVIVQAAKRNIAELREHPRLKAACCFGTILIVVPGDFR